jgi:hypothetical protein
MKFVWHLHRSPSIVTVVESRNLGLSGFLAEMRRQEIATRHFWDAEDMRRFY